MNILKKLTKEYLKMNKKRTLVTIIGVILTGAMISGVTTLGFSFQNFLVETQKQDSGDWEASFAKIKYSNVQYIENNNEIKDDFVVKPIFEGPNFADIENETTTKLMAYEQKAIDNMHILLTEGTYPTNENEVIIPDRYLGTNKNVKVGDTIKLAIDGPTEIKLGEEQNPEEFTMKDFKVVGISDNSRLSGGSYYKIVTKLDRETLTDDSIINISINAKNSNKIYEITEDIAGKLNLYENEEAQKENLTYNNSLLMYKGVNNEDRFNTMLIGVCAILILVIGIGSIIVIYNSFAISVSERKKQFGMLASIGATKKQIKKMVLYEGLIVGAIGIPLGILSGIVGIGITLKVVDGLISPMFATTGLQAHFEMIISYPALILAAIIIAITIYLSVFVPAKKASKISPIEAIRGFGDIKIKARKVKTPKFLRKIYGIEGDMALKNLKRSRKRYRTTVISLTISIVLFLTFNGFVTYMFQGFDALYMSVPYDYEVTAYSTKNYETTKEINNRLLAVGGTTKAVSESMLYASTTIDNNNASKSLKNIIKDNASLKNTYEYNKEQEKGRIPTYIISLNKSEFDSYCKQAGVENLQNDSCILVNFVDGLYMYKAQFEIFSYKPGDKIKLDVGSTMYDPDDANYKNIPNIEKELTIQKATDITPYGVPNISGYAILVVNEETFNNIDNQSDDIEAQIELLFETDDVAALSNNIEDIMKDYKDTYYFGYDVKEQAQLMRNLKLIIEIFLYGFIVLISLIGVSNIFNTITTNVNLRRREFANLKSIGMTDKAFNKMMNLECLFYGTKSLLWGLPIGCAMCYLLSKAFESEIMFMFKIPWSSIAIVIVAVYLIVFMTMKYAKGKIKKENIIDVLRDDNI